MRRLGSGRFALAYEVEHATSGERMVAKLMRREFTGDARLADRFRIDAEVLRELEALRHPNIVRFIDYCRTRDGVPCIVTELLRGSLLSEVVSAGPLSLREATRLTCQLCSALGAAHRLRVVHRDLHLRNLFLHLEPGRAPVLKVLDFGLARPLPGSPVERLTVSTSEEELVGTPAFVAPEAVRAEPVDERADVYAAGLVLLTLLTGERPFADLLEAREVYLAHVWRELPPPSVVRAEVPAELDAVVARAVAKYPEDRFQTAEQLANALRRVRLPYERGQGRA